MQLISVGEQLKLNNQTFKGKEVQNLSISIYRNLYNTYKHISNLLTILCLLFFENKYYIKSHVYRSIRDVLFL